MKKHKTINIVFATNDIYAMYLHVAIYSLIEHASSEYQYKIFILQENLSKGHINRIVKLKKENIDIEFINVSKLMEGRKFQQIRYVTKETMHRLLVDQIFERTEKVLYLDCDIIVNKDVALLYNEDISDYVLGAICNRSSVGIAEYVESNLFMNATEYFNAGILLINISKYKEESIREKCFALFEKKNYYMQDQDVLNISCRGKVKFLDSRWNMQWHHLINDNVEFIENGAGCILPDDWKDPYIIHYTSAYKPWNCPDVFLSEYFWKFARLTESYEEIIYSNVKNKSKEENPFERFIFPWNAIKPGTNIILYGAGVVGRSFLQQNNLCQYCCIKAICDKKYNAIKDINLPLIPIEKINEFNYDIIIVAIEKENVYLEIKKELEDFGIKSEKIFWQNYKRM